MKRLLAASLLLLALQARAGLFDDTVARERIDALQGQVNTLNQKAEELTQRGEDASRNQLDFTNQLEAIRTEMSKMRGQLDELNYNLDAAQKRQKDFYIDLDNRLRRLEGGKAEGGDEAAATADGAPAPAAPSADPANEGKDYEAALVALKSSRFKDALAAFSAFIKNYPKSTQQPSAHFWSGYIYSQLKDNAKAAEMYGKVAANWPTDPRAPDALAEQASSLDALGDRAGARKVREQLASKYPATDAGKQAKSALKKK